MFNKYPYTDFNDLNLDWVIKNQIETQKKADTATETANNTKDYVDEYFENLDLQEEVNTKINEMNTDGTTVDLLGQAAPPVIDAWLTSHIANPQNPPLDDTLSLTAAAAQSAAVGNRLFYGRNETNAHTRIPLYIGDAAITKPVNMLNMDVDTYTCVDSGTDIDAEAFGNLPFTPDENTSYFLSRSKRRRGSGFDIFDIMSISGGTWWRGIRPAAGGDIRWYENSVLTARNNAQLALARTSVKISENDVVVWSNHNAQANGWWSTGGAHGSNNYYTTDFLPVLPGTVWYVPYRLKESQNIYGKCLDINGNYIGLLRKTAFTQLNYRLPNAFNQAATNYVPMWYFTVPEDCYYISFNIGSSRVDNWSLSNKPIFGGKYFGDVIIREDDSTRQLANRKLCVVGPSTVMIDRRRHDTQYDYIVGYQEYLSLYYGAVDSYGYSGCSWGDSYTYDNIYPSIHHMFTATQPIVIGQNTVNPPDIAQYDDFLLVSSSHAVGTDDMATGADTWQPVLTDGRWTVSETDSYLGAIMDTVLKIFYANPNARVFVQTFNTSRVSGPVLEAMQEINTQLKIMSEKWGIILVDGSQNGINIFTGRAGQWMYDSSHYNDYGSKMIAEFYKRYLIAD